MDSDPGLSHQAAKFPWSLDLDGLDLGPRVLPVPELMSQNIVCWYIDCMRSKRKVSAFLGQSAFLQTSAMEEHVPKAFGAKIGFGEGC